MKVELRALDSVRPYKRNPRKIDAAITKVSESIKAFGFRQPIVVDGEGIIIVGHVRYAAAERLGLEKIPVHVATDLTEDQMAAYRLADNRVAQESEWDLPFLKLELTDLEASGIPLYLTGFEENELDKLLDDLNLDPTEGNGNPPIGEERLRFRRHEVPLTTEEADALEKRLQEWGELTGSHYGFVGGLLERVQD